MVYKKVRRGFHVSRSRKALSHLIEPEGPFQDPFAKSAFPVCQSLKNRPCQNLKNRPWGSVFGPTNEKQTWERLGLITWQKGPDQDPLTQ